MDEQPLNPEWIARLASRIYNETPDGNSTRELGIDSHGNPTRQRGMNPHGIPAHQPGIDAQDSSGMRQAFREASSNSPSVNPPPESLDGFRYDESGFSPSGFAPLPTGPTGIPSSPDRSAAQALLQRIFDKQQGVPSSPAAPSMDGLKGFVNQIRNGGRSPASLPNADVSPAVRLKESHSASVPYRNADTSRPMDVMAIRQDFPILHQKVHGRPLIWLDNAATTQKPQCVIDAISQFYQRDNSNIHRAAHSLAARATDAYEGAREKVQHFLGASTTKEIVFVRGTTEGINLIAQTYGRKFLQPGDEILLSVLEHHANIVPWQMIAKEKGAVLRVIPVNDHGEILMEDYQRLLGPRTKIVSLTQASNSLGTILPVEEMTHMAKRYGARVLIDGAQSVAHIPVNLQQLGCDFFVFSGHKIFGPTGIGVAYIREDLHEILPPWQGGGNMIRNVTFEETTYSEAPAKFEAGTPNIADAVGLGAALDYVQRIGLSNIGAYEHQLLQYATERIIHVPGLRLLGTAREKVGVLSFVLNNHRTEEVGKMLDQRGIAVRSGHHCAQPSLRRFGVDATVRPSISLYNTHSEIDRLIEALCEIQGVR